METRHRFKNIIAQLSVNYRKEIGEADIANFKVMLKRWGIDALENAVMDHMFDPDDGKYYPNIANIAKHITGTAKDNLQAIEDRAEIAWAKIEGEIRRIGSYGTLELEDRQALAAVRHIGGWINLCASTTDQLVWKKKEFISAYGTIERTNPESLPKKLSGRNDLAIEHKQGETALSDLMGKLKLVNK